MLDVEVDLLKVIQNIGLHKKENMRPKKKTICSFMNMNPNSCFHKIYIKYKDIASKNYNFELYEIEKYLDDLCNKKYIAKDKYEYYSLTKLGIDYLYDLRKQESQNEINDQIQNIINSSNDDDFNVTSTENLISANEDAILNSCKVKEALVEKTKSSSKKTKTKLLSRDDLLNDSNKLIDSLLNEINSQQSLLADANDLIDSLSSEIESLETINELQEQKNKNQEIQISKLQKANDELQKKYPENEQKPKDDYFHRYFDVKNQKEVIEKQFNELKRTMTKIDKDGEYFATLLETDKQLKEENRELKKTNEKLVKGDIWDSPEIMQRISMDYYRKFKELSDKYKHIEEYNPIYKNGDKRIQNLNIKVDDLNKKVFSLKEEKSKIELEKDLYKELAKCLLHEAIDLTDPDSLIPIEEIDLLLKTKKSGNLIELYEYLKANKKIR